MNPHSTVVDVVFGLHCLCRKKIQNYVKIYVKNMMLIIKDSLFETALEKKRFLI